MNLNKVFPRLSIRAKLIIAFAGLTIIPLAAASAVGAWITVRSIRDAASATLSRDLEKAEMQTARSLREAERHVAFLAREILAPSLLSGPAPRWAAAGAAVESFLGPEPAFRAIKVLDADGRVRFSSRGAANDGTNDESGVYYAWRAAETPQGSHALFPVELQEPDERDAEPRAISAIAILVPVRDADGVLRGAVVGEAYASQIFAAIESASPGFEGVTGLVDARGVYLYHSARKREWASALAAQSDSGVEADLGAVAAGTVLAGRAGTLRTASGTIIGYRPLLVAGSTEPLAVYRTLPLTRFERPVRRFLTGVLLAGVVVVALVLGLGVLAADQFTRPIYRLRSAARSLAAGGAPDRLAIATNDEIEDLAGDFERMSHEIVGHRDRLELLVGERTRALEAAHAELATVLEESADAIIGLDPDGHIRLWNRGAGDLFGWAEAEVVGRDLTEVIGPSGSEAERELAFIGSTLEEHGALVGFQTVRRTRKGAALPVSLTQTKLCGGDGCEIGSSVIIRDNRVQARLDDHLRRSERLASVSVMAAGLAHEIRNPLGILANRIEVMQRESTDRSDPALARDLEVLAAHVERLRGLTTDLLRFARDDDDDAPAPVQLDAMAARLVALLQRTFVTRNLQLVCAANGAVPPVTGREGALETVMMNLLLNAADATPSGGRVTIGVRAAPQGGAVEIEVRDNGTGIAPEVIARIFEPFFTTKGPRGGTGLGLAVCRAVVERHGGSIRVASAPGAGAAFTVTIPFDSRGIV